MDDRTEKRQTRANKDRRIAELEKALRRVEEERIVATENARTLQEMLRAARHNEASLLTASDIGVMSLDAQLHIKSATRGIASHFNIIDADIGRPITDLVFNLYYDTLEYDVEQVIVERLSKVIIIQSKDGRWFNMGIFPHSDESKALDGVIITMSDIIRLRKAEEQSRKSGDKLLAAIDRTPIIMWNQDRKLQYTWIHNPHTACRAEDVVGKTDADLVPAEDAVHLTRIKRMVLNTAVGTQQKVRTSIDGKPHYYDLLVEPLLGENATVVGLSCASMEIDKTRYEQQELERI